MGNQSSLYSHKYHKKLQDGVPSDIITLCSCLCCSCGVRGYSRCIICTDEAAKAFLCIKFLHPSSVSTSTVCFLSTSSGLVACGKRKKRSMVVDGFSGDAGEIRPQSSFDSESDSDPKVESGAEDPTTSDRDGRFLLYWLTTTSTSTTTIYTGTSTLATLQCTPGGYTLSACG